MQTKHRAMLSLSVMGVLIFGVFYGLSSAGMRNSIRVAFMAFAIASVLFFKQTPAHAFLDACEQFGDRTIGGMEEDCYPDDPFFCFDGDNYCRQIAPSFGCESSWSGICWDSANPASTSAAAAGFELPGIVREPV